MSAPLQRDHPPTHTHTHTHTCTTRALRAPTVGIAVLGLALLEVEKGLRNVLGHVLQLAERQLHGLELFRLGQLSGEEGGNRGEAQERRGVAFRVAH